MITNMSTGKCSCYRPEDGGCLPFSAKCDTKGICNKGKCPKHKHFVLILVYQPIVIYTLTKKMVYPFSCNCNPTFLVDKFNMCVCMWVSVCAWARACVRAWVRACVRACVCASVCVCARMCNEYFLKKDNPSKINVYYGGFIDCRSPAQT